MNKLSVIESKGNSSTPIKLFMFIGLLFIVRNISSGGLNSVVANLRKMINTVKALLSPPLY